MWVLQRTGLSPVTGKVLETGLGSSKMKVTFGEGKRLSQEER